MERYKPLNAIINEFKRSPVKRFSSFFGGQRNALNHKSILLVVRNPGTFIPRENADHFRSKVIGQLRKLANVSGLNFRVGNANRF